MAHQPRRMVAFRDGVRHFSVRIAGAAMEDGYVLLQRATHDDFWTLPGGRAELGEDSRETLVREMIEELGQQVEVGLLLFVVENMFDYQGVAYQELLFIYAMAIPPDFPRTRDAAVHICDEHSYSIEFQWFQLDEAILTLANMSPAFLRVGLLNAPDRTEHVIWRDPVT